MNDGTLSIIGCCVSFAALSGVYVYVRESFVYTSTAEREAERLARPTAPAPIILPLA
jgi:uncharacterized oligopeptide transporter (OPT) family protein